MTNRNAYLAVIGGVYTPVNQAVYRDVARTVHWAVNQTMAKTVYRAGNEAVFWALAPSEGPPPPGVALYLGSVA